MSYFLDTNICIYYLKGKNKKIRKRLLAEDPVEIKIPSIVKAELLYGAEKSEQKSENIKRINQFLSPLEIIQFGDTECKDYSQIRTDLEEKGNIIGPNDLIIAFYSQIK